MKRKIKKTMISIILVLIGILCAAYGVLVLGTNSGTGFFAVWFVLGAFFFALAAGTAFNVWERFPTGFRIIALVLIIAAAALFVIIEAAVFSGFTQKGRRDLDYIIVLGAQVREGGPSTVLKFRLDTAYDYLMENKETICIVSGGQGLNEPFSEASGMKDYLVNRGIEENRILVEDQSLNTKQNIDFSMKLFDASKSEIGIVTNNFHVFRSCAIARRAGMENAAGISAGSTPLFLPNNMLREFFGVLKDVVMRNM